MTAFDIEVALNSRLEELRQEFPIDIAYTAINYEPVVGTPHVIPDFIPATSASDIIGINAKNRITGLFQIRVRVPSLEGKGLAKMWVERLHDYFKRGTGIELNGVHVRVTRFRVFDFDDDRVWLTQVVRVEFRSDIDN